MRFSVPQFIEIEDKIFGPLTFKQFIYVAGGVGISFLIFNFVSSFFLAILLILPVAGLSFSLAFYRINNKPFINTMEAAFHYTFKDKLYIWKKEAKKAEEAKGNDDAATNYVPKLSDSKLKDLSWSLDVIDTTKRG